MPSPSPQIADTRFEALAQSAPDAILTIDAQSVILSANPATERIFGYAPEELVGQTLDRLIPERLRASHDEGVARYLRTHRRNIPWTGVQLPGLTKDGREIPLEISFGEFADAEGRPVFSGFVRDVSERVRYERALEEARARAERALRELATLERVTSGALNRENYDDMLRDLLHGLREELHADAAAVLLREESRDELAMRAVDGIAAELVADVVVPIGRGISGRVAATCEPLVVEDISQVEVMSAKLHEQITSIAAVPVLSGGETIGVVEIGSRARRRFSASEIRLLEIVAERMAGVFARTRLYEVERRAREESEAARRTLAEHEATLRRLNIELEQRAQEEKSLRTLAQAITGSVRIGEVMHQIAVGALSVSGAAGAYVEQVISPDGEVEVVAAAGDGTPPIGQHVAYPGSLTEEIIEKREPVFLLRMEGVGVSMAPYLDRECHGCSVLVVPLLGESTVLGSLVLLRKPDEPSFEHGIVNRVRTLGDLASLSLQRLVALAESERRRAEAEAAVRTRDDVLSIVSHDLRNPVSTVVMSVSLLQDPDFPLSEEQRQQQLGVITRSARRMNRLIQDLLDVARIEGGRLTINCRCEDPAALAAEVCDDFRPIAADKDQTLRCEIDATCRRIYADRDRVVQVLSNYLNNAVKFTPAGGTITLRLQPDDDGGVHYSVGDTGPGIPEEDRPRLFSRFWQAKHTAHLGSGLGLAIAKGIAEAHRGRVWAESTPGVGSTFYLGLPHSKECG